MTPSMVDGALTQADEWAAAGESGERSAAIVLAYEVRRLREKHAKELAERSRELSKLRAELESKEAAAEKLSRQYWTLRTHITDAVESIEKFDRE